MNEMTKPAAGDQRRGPLDHQGRRKAVPVREMRRRSETDRGHHPVRPRLVHGGAADIRSSGAGPAGFLGDGFLRPAKFRLLVRRHGRLRPLHQGSRQQRADRAGRRRLLCRRDLYRQAARQAPSPRLWHLVGRVARRAVRPAPSRSGRPPCARRHGVDRRRLADVGRAQEEAAGIFGKKPPPDRQGIHPFDLRPRPSRHGRGESHRRLRRRRHGARQFRADRHLCRHVLAAAGGRSGKDHGADA